MKQYCPIYCGVCTPFGSMTVSSCNKCFENAENTYCQYEAGKLGPKCQNAWTVSVPESEKKILVDKHNELRSLVAKGALWGKKYQAKNMRRLEWDDGLAEGAQLWANQCTWGHDEDRSNCDGDVGQNGAKNSGGDEMNAFRWADATQGWYDEIKKFKKSRKTKFQMKSFTASGKLFEKTRHFTQLIWAETTKVGCAAIAFDGDNPKNPRDLLHYCNYYPAGNIDDETIFLRKGDCPTDTSRGSDGLCG